MGRKGGGGAAAAAPAAVTSGGMVRRVPKNHRSRIVQRRMAPKVAENPKTAIFMKGEHSSDTVQKVLSDLAMLKKPHAIKFTKKNEFRPFETSQHLEFLAFKNDASLFGFGTHSKKRPHNLILGRHFDYQLLDMVELGIKQYEPMQASVAHVMLGSKPLMVFVGDGFESIPALVRVKNLLLDFFRAKEVASINLAGLDHCICVTLRPTDAKTEISVSDDGQSVRNATLLFRHYSVTLMKSGGRVPRAELASIGPTLDFEIRRCQLATPERFKHACRLPKEQVKRKEKNISTDKLGDKYGQLHVRPQTGDLMGKLGTRNFKAFRQRRRDAAVAAAAGGGAKRGRAEGGGAGALPGGEAGPAVTAKRRRKSRGGGAAARAAAAADDAG